MPQQVADYRLTLDVDTSLILPISTTVNTSWTFRSAGPDGTGSVPLPLLAVDYALPMDTDNHATGGTAELAVRQMQGIKAQKVTSFAGLDLDGRRRHLDVGPGHRQRRQLPGRAAEGRRRAARLAAGEGRRQRR